MTALVASSGPSALWYAARGSGLAALVILTLSVVLGVVTSVRWSTERWPRFVVELLHRNGSLLALGLIVVHIASVVIDAFAPIGWKDAVIPFFSSYRPIWLGLGAIAFDLLIALIVTSLLRHRIGHRTWRFVHWFAYLCWPLVVVHGLASGSDTKVGIVQILDLACVLAVLVAVWWRLAHGWPENIGTRVTALVGTLVAPFVLIGWLVSGPLAAGWARKSGTPDSVLARVNATSVSAAGQGSTTTTSEPDRSSLPAAPFTARATGTVRQSQESADGQVTIRLATTLTDGANGVLVIDITGRPLEGGGVIEDSSQVSFGPPSRTDLYSGTIVELRGTRIVAALHSEGRPGLLLTCDVQVDESTGRVTERLDVEPDARTGGGGEGNEG